MTLNDTHLKEAFSKLKPVVLPKETPIAANSEPKPVPVTARLNYTAVGVCPYCSKPMQKSTACDQVVYVCMDDRSVTPLPNSELI